MTEYVVGFMFDENMKNVLMMFKYGGPYPRTLNGIGGHIEVGELPEQAMIRECKEEVGLYPDDGPDWKALCKVETEDYKLYVYYSRFGSITRFNGKATKEGQLIVSPVNSLLNVQDPLLAGDGDLPYFIFASMIKAGVIARKIINNR